MDRKHLAALAAVLVAGCPEPGADRGPVDASGAPCCGNGEGDLAGPGAFAASFVRSSVGTTRDGGPDPSIRGVSFANAGACAGEGTTGVLQSLSISLLRPGGAAVAAGTFPVTGPDYTWPNDGGQGGPHGESCLVLLSRYSVDGGSWSARAARGSVTLDRVAEADLAGSFAVEFDPGDGGAEVLSGQFTAPLCTRGAAAAARAP